MRKRIRKCWFPGCEKKQLTVSCDEHRKIRNAWLLRRMRERREKMRLTSIQRYIEIYESLKKRRDTPPEASTDATPADVTFIQSKTSPCADCWARDQDKNRRGCIECTERIKYDMAVCMSVDIRSHMLAYDTATRARVLRRYLPQQI